jgi:hypothetical protein
VNRLVFVTFEALTVLGSQLTTRTSRTSLRREEPITDMDSIREMEKEILNGSLTYSSVRITGWRRFESPD